MLFVLFLIFIESILLTLFLIRNLNETIFNIYN